MSEVAGETKGAVWTRVSATCEKSTGRVFFRHKKRSITVSKRVLGNPIIRMISDLLQAFLIHSMQTPQGHEGFLAGSGSFLVSGA